MTRSQQRFLAMPRYMQRIATITTICGMILGPITFIMFMGWAFPAPDDTYRVPTACVTTWQGHTVCGAVASYH
jgi:hypothetical protein